MVESWEGGPFGRLVHLKRLGIRGKHIRDGLKKRKKRSPPRGTYFFDPHMPWTEKEMARIRNKVSTNSTAHNESSKGYPPGEGTEGKGREDPSNRKKGSALEE